MNLIILSLTIQDWNETEDLSLPKEDVWFFLMRIIGNLSNDATEESLD